MTANKILEIELELKKNGLTNLGIAVFKKKFLQKYEVALLIGPNEPFFCLLYTSPSPRDS